VIKRFPSLLATFAVSITVGLIPPTSRAIEEEAPPATKPAGDKKPTVAAKPSVSGLFKGNDKEAKLAHVSAHWREPFGDKPSILLVFTEKDHSKEPKPDFKARFGDFGSALVISLHEDGKIFGCEVVHTAHEKQGFSSVGEISSKNFKYADGQVAGEIMTDGKAEAFGETWEVKIKFVAPLGEIPDEFKPAEPEKPKKKEPNDKPKSTKPKPSKPTTPDDEPPSKPAAGGLNVKELPLPKDATDIEYKTLVQHLTFKSKTDVETLSAELVARLKAQGWEAEGKDLIRPHSTILKRKRGDATLSIFVKPEDGVSQVRIFTKGLVWDGKK
jgi:hypothetical protein